MKLIALIPFKNEEWILPTCLSSLNGVCDQIICIDDGSSDNSRHIAESYGSMVYDNDKLTNVGWSEHHIRQNLLRLGREAGGTHFICLDADESITAPLRDNIRSLIREMRPGQKLSLQWLAMWKNTTAFRDDQSVWSKNFKDFVVCDDGSVSHDYNWMHVGRTPGPNNNQTLISVPTEIGAIMHFQFSNWQNFQIKQCYYRCAELIHKPGTERSINEMYRITLDDNVMNMSKVPDCWYSNQTLPAIDSARVDWRFERIKTYFAEYGAEYFRNLEIWHLDAIRSL